MGDAPARRHAPLAASLLHADRPAPLATPETIPQIATEVDGDPRSAYFRQARNGLYIRMALIKMCLLGA